MRSTILFGLALLLLVLPAAAQNPPRKQALATIQKALEELPLGTPFETVKQREGFEYYDDLKLVGAKIDGVAIFANFQDGKLSRLSIHDLAYSHPQLVGIFEKQYGKPATRKSGPRTTHVFKKEGLSVVTLTFAGGKMTNLELSAPEK